MNTKSSATNLTHKHLRMIEVKNVDFHIDKRLVELKSAMGNNTSDVTRLKEELLGLSVKRHYLDPKRTIPNNY